MTKTPDTAILWLRRDLRLDDNPALVQAMAENERVLPLYIHAPTEEAPWAPGAATHWWLHGSLVALDQALRERGSRLRIATGESLAVLERIAQRTGATRVYWNRLYDPATRARDTHIKLALRARGLRCESSNALLLHEPWEPLTGTGGPYRVFSAYWRKAVLGLDQLTPLPAPIQWRRPPDLDDQESAGIGVDTLDLLPRIRWDQGLAERWQPGETAALAQARRFIDGPLAGYAQGRDLPGKPGTSSLSPHLHFGEIGLRRLLALIRERHGSLAAPAAEVFVRELGWREFAHHLLYHFPHTTAEPLDPRFARFPWHTADAAARLAAWQQGRTGVPLVDAGMRELWHTGWMHNRVRMVVASYLTKNLLLPWQAGAQWFWDTLVDADLAANTLGWQWTAGCGADAAPYFRVFNPIRQGERFDPQGDYVRHWCPELARLPERFIHQPWAAPVAVLRAAAITLGDEYPHPLVDLARSRLEALAAFETIKAT
ncbi:deoxyribodipyrimidine photo-lyase [uncultured Thiodictyon sp.]|uniref:cryptochrome/photolyase family protein n=1 Tax=uncultured Thiodictyon sp. TaxID=1846217 RepID=UPI0025FEBE58|nr:deoxyribodipyrimidine photo-lyase [uncultured Thiodictyon sp.]